MFYRPETSYYYFPKREEEQLKDKRFVFYGQVEFTEKERKYLQEYKKYLAAKKLTHTPYVTDQKIVLFLHEKQFKVQAAYKALKEHEDWRQQNLPVQLTPEIQQLLQSGIIYMCGRDNRYRPIVVMNLKLFDEKRTELIIRTFTYFFEEIIEHVLLPGQVEQWVTIMDVEGFSLFSLPLGGGRKLLNHLETHYRGRLHKLYLVNSPSAVWLSWKIVKQFLEDSTVEKVDIVSDSNIKKLYKHAHLSQIEKKFGGTQENRKVFWPGNRPIEEFLVGDDKHDKLHVTKEHYRNISKNLTNNIIHPEFLEPVLDKTEPTQPPVAPQKEEVSKPPQKVLAEEVPKPSQPMPPQQKSEEVAKPTITTPTTTQQPEKEQKTQSVPKPEAASSQPAEKKEETLVIEPPVAVAPVKDIERDREDKVDQDEDIKKEVRVGKPSADETASTKQPEASANKTESVAPIASVAPVAPVATSESKPEATHTTATQEHSSAPSSTKTEQQAPVPSPAPVPTESTTTEAHPAPAVEPLVIPPPAPLPPVTMVDVKEDKIHGEGSHIGTAPKEE